MGRVCQGFLQCLLKLLNFLLILIGIGMILYSLWMFNEWNAQQKQSDSPAPPPYNLVSRTGRASWMIDLQPSIESRFLHDKLPAPWFIYGFFVAGVIVCLITCAGHIAAETASGCCLCCYSLFLGVLLVAQGALAGVIFFDHQWEKAVPEDSTGEFDKMEDFINHNFKICKWVALGVVIVEVLSLFLAVILRSISVGSQREYDSDDEYVHPRLRQPLLNRQVSNQPNPTPAAQPEARPPRNDAWSTRMREKYGLNTTDFTYNPVDSKRQQQSPPVEERRGCVIM